MVSNVLRAALLAALVVVGSAKPYGSQTPTVVAAAAPPAKTSSSDYAASLAMDTPMVVAQPLPIIPTAATAPQTYAAMEASSAESHEELAVHHAKPSIVEGYFAMAVASASVPTEAAKPAPTKPTIVAVEVPAAPIAQPATYGSAPAPVAAVVEELPLNRLSAPASTSSYGQQAAPIAAVQTQLYNSAPAVGAPTTVEVPVAVQIPIEKLSEYSAQTPLAPIEVVELPAPAAASAASYGQQAPIQAAAPALPQPIVVAMPSVDAAYGAQQSAPALAKLPEAPAAQSYGAQPTPVVQPTAPIVAQVPTAPATSSYGAPSAPTPIVVVMPTKQQDVPVAAPTSTYGNEQPQLAQAPVAPATSAYAAPVQQSTPTFVQQAETPKPQPSYAAPAPQPILVAMPATTPAPGSSYAAPAQFDTPAIVAQPTPLKQVAVSAY